MTKKKKAEKKEEESLGSVDEFKEEAKPEPKKKREKKKPEGKLTIAVADLPNALDFPPEGSDGKGNLVKFVTDPDVREQLKEQGWK